MTNSNRHSVAAPRLLPQHFRAVGGKIFLPVVHIKAGGPFGHDDGCSFLQGNFSQGGAVQLFAVDGEDVQFAFGFHYREILVGRSNRVQRVGNPVFDALPAGIQGIVKHQIGGGKEIDIEIYGRGSAAALIIYSPLQLPMAVAACQSKIVFVHIGIDRIIPLGVEDFGSFNLKGKSTWERAEGLINIAHPAFRDELIKAADKAKIWLRTNKLYA